MLEQKYVPGGALKEGAVKKFVTFTSAQFSQISYRAQNIFEI